MKKRQQKISGSYLVLNNGHIIYAYTQNLCPMYRTRAMWIVLKNSKKNKHFLIFFLYSNDMTWGDTKLITCWFSVYYTVWVWKKIWGNWTKKDLKSSISNMYDMWRTTVLLTGNWFTSEIIIERCSCSRLRMISLNSISSTLASCFTP